MKYEFIGWKRDEDKNMDKVWGIILLEEADKSMYQYKYVSFWGRRGKKLSTKVFACYQYEMVRMYEKKEKDLYIEIPESKLHTVYPEFQDDLEKTAVWALLSA